MTPMLEQYQGIKSRHPGEILFFRLGDFYEMFGEDAKMASRILGIVLTSRMKGEQRIPMCGVPVHSANAYINRLLRAGHKVAICEQTQDADQAEGLVERAVVRVITPGTLFEEGILDERKNNYLAACCLAEGRTGLAWMDLSTGHFYAEDLSPNELMDELVRVSPSECLVPESSGEWTQRVSAGSGGMMTAYPDWIFDRDTAYRTLCDQFRVSNLSGFGCDDLGPAIGAAGAILNYIRETQRSPQGHILRLQKAFRGGRVFLDRHTQKSLELTETLHGEGPSLLSVLDRTRTAMGARLLREWVCSPLADVQAILQRQSLVAALVEKHFERKDLQSLLKDMADLERIAAKVGAGRANARDLVALRESLRKLPVLIDGIRRTGESAFGTLTERMVAHPEWIDLLSRALTDDPPHLLTEGGLIRKGYDEELDRIRSIASDGKLWIASFEAREIQRTKISSLRVGYNRVFGYYIEITNIHKEKIPSDYVRKQTLKNAERFITPDLKEYETTVLNSESRAKELEYQIFCRIRGEVAGWIGTLQSAAAAVAQIDALASLAEVAQENDYVRPTLDDSTVLEIRDGRHPVVEKVLQEKFVSNDVVLDEDRRIVIITGPNMAGKSTYIRQAALLVLMAQMGSFIPASKARIGCVDRIFTRVGASDELTRGASTFMVEMNETANILNNATLKSLLVLDEIGRGTSTFDGVSIAWAVTEYLHDRVGARTLFATHYHELTELGLVLPHVKNVHVAVKEWGDGIVFLHKISEGATDKSYGIHVARIAGIPQEVVNRSKIILAGLEALTLDGEDRPKMAKPQSGEMHQMSLFADLYQWMPREPDPLRKELTSIDVNKLTPLEALRQLAELVERAKKEK